MTRQGTIQDAVGILEGLGRSVEAKRFAAFGLLEPYQRNWIHAPTRVRLAASLPVPLVIARVNKSEEVCLVIDSGVGETQIDPAFALEAGVPNYGTIQQGGVSMALGRVDSVAIGAVRVLNVPVQIRAIPQGYSKAFPGRRVVGVLGSAFLGQFFPTIDYPGGILTLRENRAKLVVQYATTAMTRGEAIRPLLVSDDFRAVMQGTPDQADSSLRALATGDSIPGGDRATTPATLRSGPAGGVFAVAGRVTSGDLRDYAVTFDFIQMRLFLKKKEN
jgi:hypothetical protein